MKGVGDSQDRRAKDRILIAMSLGRRHKGEVVRWPVDGRVSNIALGASAQDSEEEAKDAERDLCAPIEQHKTLPRPRRSLGSSNGNGRYGGEDMKNRQEAANHILLVEGCIRNARPNLLAPP